MTRTEIINAYIKKYGFKSYLEIGVRIGENYNSVKCDYKVGVDPDQTSKATRKISSDEFFSTNTQVFDIIFIDGFHEERQATRDIENSILSLKDGGIIIVHDCNPEQEIHQKVPRESKVWNGDVWKAFVKFRANGYEQFVIDADYGCGVITTKQATPYSTDKELNWTNFVQNRKELLNLISITEWMKTM